MPVSRNYGSIEPSSKEDFLSRSVDVSRLSEENNNNNDRFLKNNKSGTKRQKRHYEYRPTNTGQRDEYSQTSADILLSSRPNGALFNNRYIVEPVAFIQNLASSIMGMLNK